MFALMTDAYGGNHHSNSEYIWWAPLGGHSTVSYTKWGNLWDGAHKSHERETEPFNGPGDSPKGETERVGELELEIAKLKRSE